MLNNYQIEFLNNVCVKNWTVTDNIVNSDGSVFLRQNLTHLPVSFGKVDFDFDIRHNTLTTLQGCPHTVQGLFGCDLNQLTRLEGGPRYVNGWYSCNNNLLTTLIGAPEICNENFCCHSNRLTSLEGCPRLIKKYLNCHFNKSLHILYGIGRVEGDVYYGHRNDLNEWIIQQARANIFVSYTDIANWIKSNKKYEFLLHSSKEIRQHFSEYIIKSVELNLC